MTATLNRPTGPGRHAGAGSGSGAPRSPRRDRSADRRHDAVRRTAIAAAASLLGAITLKGLLRDSGWLIDVALTIVVVTAPAALLRLRRPPGALDVWPGVVLMIPWLTARFVSAHALGGVIPTSGTFHDLSALMTSLHHTMHDQTAPVHSTPAVRLVLCALIGLLAALVDLIAVVGRRGALAGIPLLIVYTVSGAVPRRAVAWEWFVAAALGFLLLLSLDASDDRASWGHRVRDPGGEHTGTGVTRTAPRLAVIAIAIAVLIPLILPLQSTNLLANAFHNSGGVGGFGARDGGGGTISPFAALAAQLNRGKPEDVMTVHISSGTKSVTPFYLRSNVLDKYSDAGWSVSDHGPTEPIGSSQFDTAPANDQPPTVSFQADIDVSGLGGNVPVFTSLSSVRAVEGTTWSPQDQLLLGSTVSRGQKITETVSQPEPTVAELEAAGSGNRSSMDLSRWLATPTLPTYVTDLVHRLTDGKTSPYLRARAISNYFADPTNDFTYSLQTPVGDSGSALVDFLKGRQGFCQQYAAAMAIMLRQADVPARVVLGYMHAPPDAQGNFTVTTNDAHAWVEAYFPGVGWIPFDPTPTSGLSGGQSSDLIWAPHVYGKGSSAEPTQTRPSQTAAPRPTAQAAAPTTGSSPAAVSPTGSSTSLLPVLVGALIVLAVAAVVLTPATVRVGRRRRRLADARSGNVGALWTELTDTVVDLGYEWSAARSPRQVAAWLSRDLTHSRTYLDHLSATIERARYGRPAQTSELTGLTEGLTGVRGELRSGRSNRTRFLARFWPRSLGWSMHRH